MRVVKFASLTAAAKAGVCWSFFWRGIAITLGSMVVGFLLGALFGIAVALTGVPKPYGMQVAQIGGFTLGLLSGVMFLYLYVRWLLTSRMGRFRLVLVTEDAARAPSPQPVPSGAA